MASGTLIEAVIDGDLRLARILLESGIDVNARDAHGWAALNWAAGKGDPELVSLLLEHGADVAAVGRDTRTPLSIARAAGREEVIEMLVEAELHCGVAAQTGSLHA